MDKSLLAALSVGCLTVIREQFESYKEEVANGLISDEGGQRENVLSKINQAISEVSEIIVDLSE